MGALNFLWGKKDATLEAKIMLHSPIPGNLLLWGGENWICNRDDANRIKVLQNKGGRRTFGMPAQKVKDEESFNNEIRKLLNNMPKVEETLRNRQLLILSGIIMKAPVKCPKRRAVTKEIEEDLLNHQRIVC